jgi:hypothetical protein
MPNAGYLQAQERPLTCLKTGLPFTANHILMTTEKRRVQRVLRSVIDPEMRSNLMPCFSEYPFYVQTTRARWSPWRRMRAPSDVERIAAAVTPRTWRSSSISANPPVDSSGGRLGTDRLISRLTTLSD